MIDSNIEQYESRQRQIEEAAVNYRANPNKSGYTIDAFKDGATWADEHISAQTFRYCIYILNNTCYEDGTGVDESDIEYTIKQNNLL